MLLFFLAVLFISPALAQEKPRLNIEKELRFYPKTEVDFIYDLDMLSASFYEGRRDTLRKLLPDSSLAVFFASPIRYKANHVTYEYHQNANLYYLTGLQEPNSLLMVFTEPQQLDTIYTREALFVQPRKPSSEVWDGRRLGTTGVREVLGLEQAFENHQFADMAIDFSAIKHIYFLSPEGGMVDDKKDRGDLSSMLKHFHYKVEKLDSMVDDRSLEDVLAGMRQNKEPEELDLMRKAINFTCEALIELMKALEPGMTEFQSEAIIEYMFKKNGAEQAGFPSILGGGENSCILHYTSNRKQLSGKDLLVCDVGAEYHGYTADITRTIPVNGKFSEEQAIIYNVVLEAQKAGINAAKKGNKFWDPHNAARREIGKGLIKHGIIKNWAEIDKYFMHGTSHYLGLDVHDAGLHGSLKPGQVITVEPGIYIPEGSDCHPKWWNIGVRIEDDILVTTGQAEVLSAGVPKTIREIEELMKEQSVFNKIK